MDELIVGELIAEGRTSEVYAIDDGRVLKLFYDWCPTHWISHEVAVAEIVSSLPLQTPKIIGPCEYKARQGIIYERVTGPTMLKLSVKKPWLVFRFARLFAELQTEIHKQETNSLFSLRESLMKDIEQLDDLPRDLKPRVLDLIHTLPDGNALCHYDFHPDQVLFTDKGPVVIDWMTAKQGHPLGDVARTCIILKFGQMPYTSCTVRILISLWRGLFYRAYLSRYLALHSGVTMKAIHNWMVPVAAARLNEKIPSEHKPLLRFIRAHLNG
jgi:aminoglycoside phosphotransferase (APT) family kinase protein